MFDQLYLVLPNILNLYIVLKFLKHKTDDTFLVNHDLHILVYENRNAKFQ